MKILFIHQNFPGQFKHLAPALAGKGHEVHAFKLTTQESPIQNIQVHQYKLNRVNGKDTHKFIESIESQTIRAEALFNEALKLKESGFTPDVVIAHHGWGESLFIKDVWPECQVGIYAEYYYHATGYEVGFDPEFNVNEPSVACRLRLKNLNNLAHFQIADKAISPTQFQVNTFPENFSYKISVIHDGIDTLRLKPDSKTTLTLNSDVTLTKKDDVITFVNRNIEPYRGCHIFIRALPKILKQNPQATVIIVGVDSVSYGLRSNSGLSWKDEFVKEISNQVTQKQWKRVFFVGWVDYQTYIAILQISTVHVYLTVPFILSWSLLEAMSCECAIIASDTLPVTEVIKDKETGVLIDFFDIDGLVNKIDYLLNNANKRKALGRNARNYIKNNYDLKTICLPKQIEWVESMKKI